MRSRAIFSLRNSEALLEKTCDNRSVRRKERDSGVCVCTHTELLVLNSVIITRGMRCSPRSKGGWFLRVDKRGRGGKYRATDVIELLLFFGIFKIFSVYVRPESMIKKGDRFQGWIQGGGEEGTGRPM